MRSLPLSLVLLATAAGAADPDHEGWAQLQPLPPTPSAAPPRPAREDACQPERFIPGETPYKRVETGGSPALLYEFSTGERMNINGWQRQDEAVRRLPAPFSLTYYQFGCAGEMSYVLDVARAGRRHALYQHVLAFAVHPTRPLLFLVQAQGFTGLVDLVTKRKTPLPSLACASSPDAWFSPPSLITHGERPPRGGKTEVCVWDLDGTPRARLLAPLDWTAGAGDMVLDRVGVLEHEPDTFYVLHYDRLAHPSRCELRLQSLSQAGRSRQVDLGSIDSWERCRDKEASLSTLKLDGEER